MRCPLPVDWLDYLEGTSSDECVAHLKNCLSCRVLVEELRRDLSTRVPLHVPTLPDSHSWPRWEGVKAEAVNFGDIWWSAEALGQSVEPALRVPLLLLSDAWEEGAQSWFDVVPLSSDIENATSLDFVLLRGDTDLQVPWRVCLRLQTIASREALDTRIGALTTVGRTAVKRVLTGDAVAERFGSFIEGEDDPRVKLPDDIERSIRLIGHPYAALHEGPDAAQESAKVTAFPMLRTKRTASPADGLRLAAASASEQERVLWTVDIPDRGRIQGRLVRSSEDELLFVVEEMSEDRLGLGSPLRITFWSELLSQPATSDPFVPAVGDQVSLGRDHGVFPSEISRVEVRLSDEL